MEPWPIEEIGNDESLFYRVPVNWLGPTMRSFPGIFRENKGSISTDWERYSSASQTRARQGRPERFAIIRLVAGSVREIDGLSVVHSPVQNIEGLPDNQAHTDIFGLESSPSLNPELGRKERIRTELHKRFNEWEIPPNAPVE
jgi:hypothetical protein